MDLVQLVQVNNGQAVTTSMQVAEYFGKRHTHVLDKIKQLIDDTPKDFAEPNFRLCFKINQLQNGKPQAYYEMTKDGFVLLAMGFTGKKAIEFKIDYINAFNEMADFILSDGINLQQQFLIADKEFKTATEIASNAGYTLNYVGKKVKPEKKQKRDSLFARLQMALPFFESKAV